MRPLETLTRFFFYEPYVPFLLKLLDYYCVILRVNKQPTRRKRNTEDLQILYGFIGEHQWV